MKAKTDYQTEFNVLSTSGAGVILTRAREPFRVIEALKETAIQRALGNPAKPFGFRHWSVRTGWATPDLTDASAAEVMDGTAAPQAALNKITDLAGGGKAAFTDGIYILSGMHPWLSQEKPDPILVETLRKYAYDFATDNRRVVLVMPESFVLPPELQHDIPVLDYELPDSGELRAVLDEVLASAFPEGEVPEVFTEAEIAQTVASATGMTRLEAELAFSQAVIRNQQALPNIPFDAFNRVVLETKTTVVKRSEVLELMPPGRVEDVGGLDQLKAWIARRKKCFTKAASDFGVVPPKGIALIGPPGTGKSVSAKAIAATLGFPLIRFDVGRVFGSLVGQTEGRVRSALKQMEAMAPCVTGDTEILMGDGSTRTVDDLRGAIQAEGDLQGLQILTVNDAGERVESRVRGWIPRGKKIVIEIVDELDNLIRVTDEHKFLIRNPDGSLEWREAKNLREGDDIVRYEECGCRISADA